MVILYGLLYNFKAILWYKGLEDKVYDCSTVFLQFQEIAIPWRYIEEHIALSFNKYFESIYKTHKTTEDS